MDHVIGAIDYHDWADVCCWFASIKRSGFRGNIALLVYEHTTDATLAAFEKRGIKVLRAKSTRGVNEDRFRDLADFLSGLPSDDRVFATDVRDVVFQRNPSALLDEGLKQVELMIASEGWTFSASAWNRDNVVTNFPDRIGEISEYEIFCAGVLAGRAGTLQRLFRETYEVSRQALSFNGDQVALNIVMRRPQYIESINRLQSQNPLICHYGPVLAQSKSNTSGPGLDSLSVQHGALVFNNNINVGAFHQYTRESFVRFSVALRYRCLLDFYGGKAVRAVNERLGKTPQWMPYWKS